MKFKQKLWLYFLYLIIGQELTAKNLLEQLKKNGYVEFCDKNHGTHTYEKLYIHFDELVNFLQNNPNWAKKLDLAKKRFIRSTAQSYYSTDFFGLYDESQRPGRNQVSFYYTEHFHDFIYQHYPEFCQIAAINHFLEDCLHIQKAYSSLFKQTAAEIGLNQIFSGNYNAPPILFKVVKYLPTYIANKPHYDGTAFSLLLDSTDNQSLLLAPYKDNFVIDDFKSPNRNYFRQNNQNSILLIPGTWLSEFSILPTPHIVTTTEKTRYATIAFAMRADYYPAKMIFSPLPKFKC